jgi:hypothetical protein
VAKRRRRRLKPIEVNPVERVLGELLGEVQHTIVQSVQQMLMPPPQFREEHAPMFNTNADRELQQLKKMMERQQPIIKDAEVISIRKG